MIILESFFLMKIPDFVDKKWAHTGPSSSTKCMYYNKKICVLIWKRIETRETKAGNPECPILYLIGNPVTTPSLPPSGVKFLFYLIETPGDSRSPLPPSSSRPSPYT